MPYFGSIQVQDRSGWAKTFRLEKALVMVGSAPINDIVLPEERGDSVLPVHLQLLHPQPELVHVRAVNLTNSAIPLLRTNPAAAAAITANAYQDLENGDALQVGQFTLTLSLQSGEGFSRSQRSEHLGLRLELPTPKLRAARQLDGLLTVTNFGSHKRCQFVIDLEGLPPDCYQIDPAPLLYPNGEEQLRIRLFHRGTRPPAGTCPVCLRMTASGAYPTEEVVLPFNLEVAPVYQVDVCILDCKETPIEWAAAVPAIASPPVPAFAPAVSTLQPSLVPDQMPSQASFPPEPDTAIPAPPAQPISIEPEAKEQSPITAPTAEQESDWWSDTVPTQTTLQPLDPYSRRGIPRKPRLAPNQNIQVLRTPQAPAGGDADLPIPQPENNGHNE